MSSKKDDKPVDVREQLTLAAKGLQQIAKPLVAVISFLLPAMIWACQQAYRMYQTLPKNAVRFWTGFVFCFFGGLYPVTFAAVQAAEFGGRQKVVESLTALAEEATVVIDASKKDDEKDDDGDGIADVNQIDGQRYTVRKLNLVLTKMNPKKVDDAMANLYTVWLSVIAVLMVQFARTISLALSMAEFMKKPVNRFITPTIKLATPDDYKKWVPVVLGWIIKSIAMSVAWYIQTVISAFTSALSGGQTMAMALFDFLLYRKITLGGLVSADTDKTYIDEVLMYVFAGLGLWFQFSVNFDMPFPFNLVTWPLELLEYYLRWTITKAEGTAA